MIKIQMFIKWNKNKPVCCCIRKNCKCDCDKEIVYYDQYDDIKRTMNERSYKRVNGKLIQNGKG